MRTSEEKAEAKLLGILKENPGCTALLDTDEFWLVKTLDTGDDHWSEVEGNELHRGGRPDLELMPVMAQMLNIKIDYV